MVLTDANYYSVEANKEYMSVSQFKSFRKCEFAALQEVNGEYSRAESTALLVGSYVDAYYEGTLDHFRDTHPDIFKRDGSLKADYAQAELIIRRLRIDPFFSKYMSGDKQLILTGQIEGIPFKCKIDSFHSPVEGSCSVKKSPLPCRSKKSLACKRGSPGGENTRYQARANC